MKLLERCTLLIEERKVVRYLLSRRHPIGREKAAFFKSLGFGLDNWILFAEALRRTATAHPARLVGNTRYGREYVVRGTLEGPTGKKAMVAQCGSCLKEKTISSRNGVSKS